MIPSRRNLLVSHYLQEVGHSLPSSLKPISKVRHPLLACHFARIGLDGSHASNQLWRGWKWAGAPRRCRSPSRNCWCRAYFDHALLGHRVDWICREYRGFLADRLRHLPRVLQPSGLGQADSLGLENRHRLLRYIHGSLFGN